MNWFKKFMTGRYGGDQLNNFLLIIFISLFILSRFINISIIPLISLLILFIAYFRIFSKNIAKRYAENQSYLKFWNPIKKSLNSKLNRVKNMRHYKYFKCPNCEQTLRVPRGKGRISIKCPKCKSSMIRKS